MSVFPVPRCPARQRQTAPALVAGGFLPLNSAPLSGGNAYARLSRFACVDDGGWCCLLSAVVSEGAAIERLCREMSGPRAALYLSQAKEPVAIQPYRREPTKGARAGGSSRRGVTRITSATSERMDVTGRRDGCFWAGSRPSHDPNWRDVTRRDADQSLTAGRDRQPKSQAKEPVAIPLWRALVSLRSFLSVCAVADAQAGPRCAKGRAAAEAGGWVGSPSPAPRGYADV